MFKKIIGLMISFTMLFEQTGFAQVVSNPDMSGMISGMFNQQSSFRPLHLRSLFFNASTNDFHVFVDKGNAKPTAESIKSTSGKLFEYFLTGLSLPNSLFWVNLRPDRPDDVIDPLLAKTDLGRVLLEADVQLKKDLSAYTSPDTACGKQYWTRLYAKAQAIYGNANVSIPTISRPWIVPGEIILCESATGAYIYKAVLKVMLERDYLKNDSSFSFSDSRQKELNDYSAQLIRELIIPKLIKDVNSSKRYATARQVYYSLIMAQWFKRHFNSGNGGSYTGLIDSKNLTGIASRTAWSKDSYYQSYKDSFERGEYNKQETVTNNGTTSVRRYCSGGWNIGDISTATQVIQAPLDPAKSGALGPNLAEETINGGMTILLRESVPEPVGQADAPYAYELNREGLLNDRSLGSISGEIMDGGASVTDAQLQQQVRVVMADAIAARLKMIDVETTDYRYAAEIRRDPDFQSETAARIAALGPRAIPVLEQIIKTAAVDEKFCYERALELLRKSPAAKDGGFMGTTWMHHPASDFLSAVKTIKEKQYADLSWVYERILKIMTAPDSKYISQHILSNLEPLAWLEENKPAEFYPAVWSLLQYTSQGDYTCLSIAFREYFVKKESRIQFVQSRMSGMKPWDRALFDEQLAAEKLLQTGLPGIKDMLEQQDLVDRLMFSLYEKYWDSERDWQDRGGERAVYSGNTVKYMVDQLRELGPEYNDELYRHWVYLQQQGELQGWRSFIFAALNTVINERFTRQKLEQLQDKKSSIAGAKDGGTRAGDAVMQQSVRDIMEKAKKNPFTDENMKRVVSELADLGKGLNHDVAIAAIIAYDFNYRFHLTKEEKQVLYQAYMTLRGLKIPVSVDGGEGSVSDAELERKVREVMADAIAARLKMIDVETTDYRYAAEIRRDPDFQSETAAKIAALGPRAIPVLERIIKTAAVDEKFCYERALELLRKSPAAKDGGFYDDTDDVRQVHSRLYAQELARQGKKPGDRLPSEMNDQLWKDARAIVYRGGPSQDGGLIGKFIDTAGSAAQTIIYEYYVSRIGALYEKNRANAIQKGVFKEYEDSAVTAGKEYLLKKGIHRKYKDLIIDDLTNKKSLTASSYRSQFIKNVLKELLREFDRQERQARAVETQSQLAQAQAVYTRDLIIAQANALNSASDIAEMKNAYVKLLNLAGSEALAMDDVLDFIGNTEKAIKIKYTILDNARALNAIEKNNPERLYNVLWKLMLAVYEQGDTLVLWGMVAHYFALDHARARFALDKAGSLTLSQRREVLRILGDAKQLKDGGASVTDAEVEIEQRVRAVMADAIAARMKMLDLSANDGPYADEIRRDPAFQSETAAKIAALGVGAIPVLEKILRTAEVDEKFCYERALGLLRNQAAKDGGRIGDTRVFLSRAEKTGPTSQEIFAGKDRQVRELYQQLKAIEMRKRGLSETAGDDLSESVKKSLYERARGMVYGDSMVDGGSKADGAAAPAQVAQRLAKQLRNSKFPAGKIEHVLYRVRLAMYSGGSIENSVFTDVTLTPEEERIVRSSLQTVMKDGGQGKNAQADTGKGGVDMASLPAVTMKMNQLPGLAGAMAVDMNLLKRQWSQLKKQLRLGKAPVDELDAYVQTVKAGKGTEELLAACVYNVAAYLRNQEQEGILEEAKSSPMSVILARLLN